MECINGLDIVSKVQIHLLLLPDIIIDNIKHT